MYFITIHPLSMWSDVHILKRFRFNKRQYQYVTIQLSQWFFFSLVYILFLTFCVYLPSHLRYLVKLFCCPMKGTKEITELCCTITEYETHNLGVMYSEIIGCKVLRLVNFQSLGGPKTSKSEESHPSQLTPQLKPSGLCNKLVMSTISSSSENTY